MPGGVTVTERFEPILQAITREARRRHGERLVSLAVYGSVGRGTPRPYHLEPDLQRGEVFEL